MIRAWLHDRMPRSLAARGALIVLVPVVLLQLGVSLAFVQRYYDDVTRQMTRVLVRELRVLVQATEAAPSPESALAYATAIAAPLQLEVALPAPLPPRDAVGRWDLPGRAMADTMRASLPALAGADMGQAKRVTIWLSTRHGDLLVAFDRRRIAATNPHQLLVITLVLGALLATVAFLFLRNQLRPIQRLAAAAQAYGRGRVVPVRIAGATEVRAATAAFLAMRARLERQAQARTTMLAGVSHDLRTPLTRLRLGLSLVDHPEARAMARDVDDMAGMLDAFLAFARDDAADAPEPVDLAALLRDAAGSAARAGLPVELGPLAAAPPLPLRPLALRRAVDNLVANAARHAARVALSLEMQPATVHVLVDDDGPGIPEGRRDEAMRPFARLDDARNQDRPGVGLGLAIVADAARAHGGLLRLSDSPMGGLRAEIVLPR